MSCTSDPPSCSVRASGSASGTPRGLQRAGGITALALAALLGSACTGSISAGGGDSPTGPTGGGGGSGGGPVTLSKGGVMLRLLTQAEYRTSIQALLGTVTAQLTLPDDVSVAGFASVGASQMSVTDTAATSYEDASLKATAEVFADTQRWQKLVGCAPSADLSDDCVTTYIKNFGKAAFRRDLTTDEVTQWVGVARNAATLAGTAAQGLATVTSGLLQSPNFLYRVEVNKLDNSNRRLKYDGLSMASRLSYLLTGGPPSAALLAAAASGQLDTAAGVRTAAAPLLTSGGLADRMTAFFSEYAQAPQVLVVDKSASQYPMFNAALQNSMFQGLQLFLKNIVLAPNADVRSFYDSDQTFVDANLAAIYGVQAPASGFGQVTVPASQGRVGILGQAAIIAAQSQPDRTSPTRRGVFILESLLCTTPPSPPQGVNTIIIPDPTKTTRQQLEAHRASASCAACHKLFDPLGLALEHFDAIGRYRAMDNGQAIDATGTLNNMSFDGEAQLGAALRQDPNVLNCLMRNFYRNANGRAEDDKDPDQINGMVQSLSSHNYVWTNLVADFVASDAFRSAPALPVN